jgi:arabinoxylan arabinofuranohydrolase
MNTKINFSFKLCLFAMTVFNGMAQNNIKQKPIIQTKYTADPAPMVHNDTVFLYTSHDEDDATGFKMKDWLLYSSTDMVNWTDHGIVASLKDFSWVKHDNGAWAIQCIERNGKFYLYAPMHGQGIGVLVSDSPYGPFNDPLGKRLIEDDHIWNDIDPSPFIVDDGQAYLCEIKCRYDFDFRRNSQRTN